MPFKKLGINNFKIVSNKVTNKTEDKIIELMRDNPNNTIQQIMVKTGLPETGAKKNLKQLKEKRQDLLNNLTKKFIKRGFFQYGRK